MKFETYFARFFSAILQPLLMPFYSVALLLVYATTLNQLFLVQYTRILVVVFVCSFIAPICFITLLKRLLIPQNTIETGETVKDEDQFLPYVITLLSNISLFMFFFFAHVPVDILSITSLSIVLIISTYILTHFHQLSAHMIAFGGVTGGVFSMSYNIYRTNPFLLFIVLFILAGCLGVSRLALKQKMPLKVYLGFILGIIVGYTWILFAPSIIRLF